MDIVRRLKADVLESLKKQFVGKDEIIDLLGVSLVSGENLFLFGPPGTAKSALVHGLAKQIGGSMFDYLLTRFTEPNELFGPFDIRRLRDGDLVTNTEGMLPEANLVFLDELLNANSAILNSLLMALNERVFRRGRETRNLPALMFVGASNRLPEDETLGALFDRFLLRVNCPNVEPELLLDVLSAGWSLESRGRQRPDSDSPSEKNPHDEASLIAEIRQLQRRVFDVDLSDVRQQFVGLVQRLRQAGLSVSDRRAVKLQRAIAASAILCERPKAIASDLWVVRYIWDSEEQQEILVSIVSEYTTATDNGPHHPRSTENAPPDPERIARDLERLEEKIAADDPDSANTSFYRDQLAQLAARTEWVVHSQQREFLLERIDSIWTLFENR